jgi:hypothetical protein
MHADILCDLVQKHHLHRPHASVCAEHYVDELEPLLETIILEDFNVQAEDGSPGQVC